MRMSPVSKRLDAKETGDHDLSPHLDVQKHLTYTANITYLLLSKSNPTDH
jgi:hypothetical protein